MRESAFTNNAAAQSAEGAAKAQSAITLTLQESKVATIAHWLKSSRQALSDSDALREYLDRRLRYGTCWPLKRRSWRVPGRRAASRGGPMLTTTSRMAAVLGAIRQPIQLGAQSASSTRRTSKPTRSCLIRTNGLTWNAKGRRAAPPDWRSKGPASKQPWTQLVHTPPPRCRPGSSSWRRWASRSCSIRARMRT